MVMKLRRESQKEVEEKKDDKKPSSRNPLAEGIAKKTTAVVLALGMATLISSCEASWGPNGIPDGGDQDAIVDARDGDVDNDLDKDGDIDEDAGIDAGPDEDLDAGVDAGPDEDLDAGVDAGPDEDLDAGVDAGPDEDLDAGVDAGSDGDFEPLCPGAHNETVDHGNFSRDEDVLVGGYYIRYVSATVRNVSVDVRCADSNAAVAIDQSLRIGDETVIEAPEDGKKIRITVHSQNAWGILCTVVVEDL